MSIVRFDNMIGRTFCSVEQTVDRGEDNLIFKSDDGSVFKFYHQQDCCESVYIEDICGDLNDLVGSPLLEAEEVSNMEVPETLKQKVSDDYYSYTWTFYRFGTNKGSVTVRWLGTSNGYYSECVNYEEKIASPSSYSMEGISKIIADRYPIKTLFNLNLCKREVDIINEVLKKNV